MRVGSVLGGFRCLLIYSLGHHWVSSTKYPTKSTWEGFALAHSSGATIHHGRAVMSGEPDATGYSVYSQQAGMMGADAQFTVSF